MPLQDTNFTLTFANGLDTKTDRKQVVPGKLLELENGVFNNVGAINKRYGYSDLSLRIDGGDAIEQATALSTYRDELLLFTGERVYSRLESTDKWADRGKIVSAPFTTRSVIADGYNQANPDMAINAGLELYAWEDSRGGVRYSVLDSDTGAFIVSNASVTATGSKPRCVAIGAYLLAFFVDGASVKYCAINVTQPSVLQPEQVATSQLHAVNGVYDVAAIGDRLFMAYANNTTGTGLLYLDTNLSASSPLNTDGYAERCITVFGDAAQNAIVGFYDGTDVQAYVTSYALNQVLAPTTVDTAPGTVNTITGVETSTANTYRFYHEIDNADSINQLIRTNTLTVDGYDGYSSVFMRSVGLASKAFKHDSTIYVSVAYESTLQSTYLTVDADSNVVAKIAPQLGGGHRTNGMLAQVAALDSTYQFAHSQKKRLLSEEDNGFSKSNLFTLLGVAGTSIDFGSENTFLNTELGNNLLTVGGIIQSYDGVGFTEHNFHFYPDSDGIEAESSDTGTPIFDGYFQYVAVYEWSDNNGAIQRSTTSEPITVETGAPSDAISVTIPTLRVTAKRGDRANLRVALYRTEDLGTVFYRVTSVITPLFNDPSVDSVTFVDTVPDTDLIARETLYTTGSVLDSDAPPAAKCITTYRNRVWLGGLADDPQKLWYSQILIPGEPVWFSQYLTSKTDQTGGRITALAKLDDALIIFKENALYRLSGEGPDNTGNQGFYDDPQLITSDVGCTNPNSVATTPDGLVFQSAKGLMLLDRSYAIQYIGQPVQAFNALRVSSTTTIPDQNIVVFTTDDDQALVYDYNMSRIVGEPVWSTFTNHEAVDSLLWRNTFCFVRSNGVVSQQDQSRYTDGSNFVRLKLKTAYVNLAGLNGYKRIRTAAVLGEFKGPHQLVIQTSYDYNENFRDVYNVDATSIMGSNLWGSGSPWGSDEVWGGYYTPYQFILPALKRQKCTSIAFTISDSQSSGYNEGYSISGLTMVCGVKPGLNKMPRANKIGS